MLLNETNQWVEQELQKEVDFSQTDFQQELDVIKNQRVAFAHEPLVNHVSSWSLPILNYKNELVAAIAIVGFTDQTPKNNDSAIVQQVHTITNEMSKTYGYKAK